MYFRSLILYRIAKDWPTTAAEFAEQLSRCAFQPCGTQDAASRGFVPPRNDASLVHAVGDHWLICLQTETRLLPSSVVRDEVADRAEQLEAQQGFKPGRKQLAELKDAVTQELMPKAFTTRRKVFAWINVAGGFLAIDAPSKAGAESVIEAMLKASESFPIQMLDTERTPTAAMTDWVAGGEAPAGFTVDSDAELRAVAEEKSAVTYKHHSLEGKDIREHIGDGKQVIKLALTFDSRVSFLLTDTGAIKRLDFLDAVRDSLADDLAADQHFNAEFAVMCGELSRMVPALLDALGGLRRAEKGDLVDQVQGAAE